MRRIGHAALSLTILAAATATTLVGSPSTTAPATAPAAVSGTAGVGGEAVDCSSGFYWEHRECPVPILVALDDIEPVTGVDTIPALDDPAVEPAAAAADWLADTSPVLAVAVDGRARLYPLAILTFHEVVNDVLAGRPVLVTYCPLCNSGVVFDRHVGGETLVFGTSGLLYRGNLVAYDRQHENLWVQILGRAVVGAPFGEARTELTRLPADLLGFAEARRLHPDADVLARPDPAVDYGRNPYRGYDDGRGVPSFRSADLDGRLPAMARVVGLDVPDHVAVTLDHVRERGTVRVGDVTVAWTPGQASALEAARVDDGRDVGTTVALRTGALELVWRDRTLTDPASGATYDLDGRVLSPGPGGDAVALPPVPHLDTFWFAWTGAWGAVPLVSGS